VRGSTVWVGLLGIEHATVERVEYDEDAQLIVAHVRPSRTRRDRCGKCGARSPRSDAGEGRPRWRTLDLGVVRAVLEANAPRVRCRVHGVTVAAVPWARHDTGHTRSFDDQVAWLAVQCFRTAVTELMRIAWRTVGAIITRVCADIGMAHDRLGGLRRIGIGEISDKRGHKYLTVVVDHDARRLVWATPGRDKATLGTFFDVLRRSRCGPVRPDHPRDSRCSRLDRRCGEATVSDDGAVRGRLSRCRVGDGRFRSGPRQAWNDARRLARSESKGRSGRPRKDGTQASGPRPGHERAKALKAPGTRC